MTLDEKKELVLRMHDEIWNQGKLDNVEDLYCKNFVAHYPGNEWIGIEGIKNTVKFIKNAFPNWHEEVKDIIISDDKVVTRFISRGTHNGYFIEIAPSGREVEIEEIAIFRIEDGKIAEQWGIFDGYKMMEQIGAIKR